MNLLKNSTKFTTKNRISLPELILLNNLKKLINKTLINLKTKKLS